ncbi:hypothetical protein BS50DRAFT_137133 [Corynespora cassiicola Philippines]|uniref:Uncharacterized protein n=1 Tax=Corynespora cassiicola Philippines TaxID=1448308 RepID=A0A2T2NA22_CORCC|nr:hypothetical protein BS50DRAFT_137133 [Corynespora cassiicola Philippines]
MHAGTERARPRLALAGVSARLDKHTDRMWNPSKRMEEASCSEAQRSVEQRRDELFGAPPLRNVTSLDSGPLAPNSLRAANLSIPGRPLRRAASRDRRWSPSSSGHCVRSVVSGQPALGGKTGKRGRGEKEKKGTDSL